MSYQHHHQEVDGDTGKTWAVGKWFVHGQSDELMELWPPRADQQNLAHYLAYEIALDVRIDMATGAGQILGISGTSLKAPVSL